MECPFDVVQPSQFEQAVMCPRRLLYLETDVIEVLKGETTCQELTEKEKQRRGCPEAFAVPISRDLVVQRWTSQQVMVEGPIYPSQGD